MNLLVTLFFLLLLFLFSLVQTVVVLGVFQGTLHLKKKTKKTKGLAESIKFLNTLITIENELVILRVTAWSGDTCHCSILKLSS